MRVLVNTHWRWPWRRAAWVGCAWQEGQMVGVQLQPLASAGDAIWQVRYMHVCAHDWGAHQLAQGQASGLPWERLHANMGSSRAQLSLACPVAWVASGEYAAQGLDKRKSMLAEVQVHAAQAVGEGHADVCFDVHMSTDGPWHWWATSRRWIEQVQTDLAPLGTRLARIAPLDWAQQHALARLHGGESSLQARPPMDWQFSKEPQHAERAVKTWLQSWTMTVEGSRLAACGMALPV